MRPSKMKTMAKPLAALLFVALLIFPFMNCDNYSSGALFGTLHRECNLNEDCYVQDESLLQLRINTLNNLQVASTVRQFNVGGDCNEGGFPNNKIIWELETSGNPIYSATENLNGKCENGRFAILIDLLQPGLNGTRGLEVEIIGIDESGQEHKNPGLSRQKIYLVPAG